MVFLIPKLKLLLVAKRITTKGLIGLKKLGVVFVLMLLLVGCTQSEAQPEVAEFQVDVTNPLCVQFDGRFNFQSEGDKTDLLSTETYPEKFEQLSKLLAIYE